VSIKDSIDMRRFQGLAAESILSEVQISDDKINNILSKEAGLLG